MFLLHVLTGLTGSKHPTSKQFDVYLPVSDYADSMRQSKIKIKIKLASTIFSQR